MTITISTQSIIITIFIIHTILTHLFNWSFRSLHREKDDDLFFEISITYCISLMITIGLIIYYLN
jgi:hypothetical protein